MHVARRHSVTLTRCTPMRLLAGRAASLRRCASVLSDAQRLRTVPQAFWRSEAENLDGAMPGQALCRDPFARLLAEALLPASELQGLVDAAQADVDELAVIEGIRCAFLDRFIIDSLKERMRQVVILGSGMDCRAMRLAVPPQMVFVEVDDAAVHEAKLAALEGTGAAARCLVRRQAVALDGNVGSAQLVEAIAPALNLRKPALFILDGALSAWPAELRLPAVAAAAELAAAGSVIVGPAPEEDVIPTLQQAGFGKVNFVVQQQLEKIYRRPVPASLKMMVALHGPAPSDGGQGAHGGGAARGGGCGGKGGGDRGDSGPSRGTELKF